LSNVDNSVNNTAIHIEQLSVVIYFTCSIKAMGEYC